MIVVVKMARSGRSASLRAAFGRAEIFFLFTRHLFLSSQARLGNVPGYYRSSLTGLGHREFGFAAFVRRVAGPAERSRLQNEVG